MSKTHASNDNFSPNNSRPHQKRKTRPVLVIQTDLLTRSDHPSCIVLPLTPQVQETSEPLRVHIPPSHAGFDRASDVMIDQIRAIDNRRLYRGNTGVLIKEDRIGRCRNPSGCLALVLDLDNR